MAEKHIQAQKDYVKGMKYKDLAEKYGVSINTIKSWKQRHGWERKKGAPIEKSVHTKKGGQPGNKNALGNKGGAAPAGNQNAVTHGFFSKFLPEETLEIMEEIQERSPADMIWDQIQIQYAAIIWAQRIMFVKDKDDTAKELKKAKYVYHQDEDEDGNLTYEKTIAEEELEIQFAWDRHATFLNAQSRAMGELRSLIKQFDDLAHSEDERRLKLEQMRLNINKTKAEVERLTNNEDDASFEIIIKDKGGR
ncbi:phage terminase small subunit [Bacillus atrophaeus]|uniref:phage terminase small subunit n=1 Tax=Bacillus atrophaeus TaxID=1452 RepID=UPI002DB808C1|nr:phage terminase small subunit [Bacillus atrophaeus]MEC1900973.1 phage terminase small subunit [Bacillus atrophaeus]MEC2396138.1 phage terminase small subunit [Bacillus atrophaeus]MED4437310.1 phage terminase small subunit [Bacillus atrophaeus]MED4567054.1 phage terminase small subunit [Bacillus atrophaeus]MED4573376.1 phage terminase small subunit [Bacillus atrophaeus]